MIKRVLHATQVPPKAGQREQIFHFRYKVADKTYCMIIDGGAVQM